MPKLDELAFSVEPTPPFKLELTSWALRRRRTNEIDRFDGVSYQRAITVRDKVVVMTVNQAGSVEKPRLEVKIEGVRIGSEELRSAMSTLKILLGLSIDLTDFYRLARSNPRILELVKKFRGVKPPRFPSIFETLLNAISCQQVSLTVGLLLLNRLVQNYGRGATGYNSSSPLHAFPLPHDLSDLKPDNLRQIGFSAQKSKYIVGLANLIVNKKVNLEELAKMKDEEALEYLQTIPGVGRWSSQYVLLRGLGRLNRFPADDVGAQNGLQRFLNLRKKPDYERTSRLIEPYQPYSGLIYFHLLLNRLEKEGVFQI
ncbi:MAG TPA: hypothetical protein VJN71_02620 [Nitrososphaerales archaeon]|nr:hypothetical protein [Nitrososphaerales archaeon]